MDEYLLFEAFERGEYVQEQDIKKLTNYRCGPLISWSPNWSSFECQYNYATKLPFVCTWKQKHGFAACAKKGEAICDDKLANFFKEKDHKKCICSKV